MPPPCTLTSPLFQPHSEFMTQTYCIVILMIPNTCRTIEEQYSVYRLGGATQKNRGGGGRKGGFEGSLKKDFLY